MTVRRRSLCKGCFGAGFVNPYGRVFNPDFSGMLSKESRPMSDQATPPAAPQAPVLPPLYKGLEPLTAERHGKLKLVNAGVGVAAQMHAVPLAAEEFTAACRTMPIVFTAQAPHVPLALCGLQAGHNHFVTAEGKWHEGTYLPAYLRRYPFFLVRVSAESQQLVLCVDPQAPHVSASEGDDLFTADGKPSAILDRAFTFTKAVEEAMLRTRAMADGLAELGLLKPSVVQFQHKGQPMRVDGFFAVDRTALAALTGEQLATLRDRGWLEAIYAHLLSVGGMSELARDVTPTAA